MDPTVIALVAIGVSIILPALSYLAGEARAKGRAEATELATKKALDDLSKDVDAYDTRIKALEISNAVSIRDISSVTLAVASLRAEIDRRFDQLERIISGSGLHKRERGGDL